MTIVAPMSHRDVATTKAREKTQTIHLIPSVPGILALRTVSGLFTWLPLEKIPCSSACSNWWDRTD